VTFLYGVSRFQFTALALAVVLSLFASYFVAMTVVPLFCAKLMHGHQAQGVREPARSRGWGQRFSAWFNRKFTQMLDRYEAVLNVALLRPLATILGITGLFLFSLGLYPLIGQAYFPRTDPGQFVINLKAPAGLRLELTDQLVGQVEQIVREEVPARELKIVVSNIGVTPGFSSIYTPNAGPHTAFVQVGLQDERQRSSFDYMRLVRERLQRDLPQLSAYFQTGGLVDAVLNLGLPAPLDIQVSGMDMGATHRAATEIAQRARALPGVSDVLVPQDIDYPALKLDIDRVRASQLGLTAKETVNSVITALTSDGMIAPSYWVDPKTGNDYFLTVQYPEDYVKNLADLGSLPLRASERPRPTRLDSVSRITHIKAPTEVDHYQLQRIVDVYVAPAGEDLSAVYAGVQKIIDETRPRLPEGIRVNVRGSVQAMQASFKSFGLGLILSTLLVYLILVAQFESFLDPFLILLAVPTGLTGVLLILFGTGTTLNVMSLMGVVMMVGIVVSNSILIVDFTRRLRGEGRSLREAVALACRIRLRPILMTSLATLIGLLPMAVKLGTGAEAYAPLARAIIGGLGVSVVLTMFIVPAAYLLAYRGRSDPAASVLPAPGLNSDPSHA
jgi:hydrophobic/amphiphilic exporter-1 (mainly G- bacteria), HAE1 family